MNRIRPPHPDQLPLELSHDGDIEREIEARAAERAETAAWYWRFRLILVESFLVGVIAAVACIALQQPAVFVASAAILTAAACLVTGVLFLNLSAWAVRVVHAWRKRRAS